MSSSRTLFLFCLFFILGVAFDSWLSSSQIIILAFLSLALVLIFLFRKKKNFLVIGFCLLFLVLGMLRHQNSISLFKRPEVKKLGDKNVVAFCQVIEEPERMTGRTRIKARVRDLKMNILITSSLYPQIKYGDFLKVEGILLEPPVFEGFSYRDFLKKEGIYFLMSYPEIEILKTNTGNPLKSLAISLKSRLRAGLERIVSFEQAGFFEALLFGQETNISNDWLERLNITGVRHLAAVSGTNITILSSLLLNLILALGFWRQQSLKASLFLLFFYVLMIGAPASALRAAIMGAFFLISQNFGRLCIPERIMVLAMAIMLFFNPLLLKLDIGFQLSFLAIAGLIYLQPFFLKLFKKMPELFGLRLNLASTLSAQVFVLPVLLYNFGQFSLISPLANVFILPFIPYLTLFGFFFSFLGIFSFFLGKILSLPFQVMMLMIMKIIGFFSAFSWASQKIALSWFFVILCYFLLGVFVFYIRKKQRLEFLNY